MHFLNVGKWDITWVLSLNCLWLVLPAICPNSATVVICLGWMWCSGSDLYHWSFPQDLSYSLPSDQYIPAQSTHKPHDALNCQICSVRAFSSWHSERGLLQNGQWPCALWGYTPIRQQSLGQATEQELGWPFYKCLKCQLLLLPKRIFSLNSE